MGRSFGSSQARLLFLVLVGILLSVQATRVASRFLRPPLTPGKVLEVEEREDGDEGCPKRRMTSDVHLDYIYTQKIHKP
ncbi:hypothetical protein OPV22_015510 [Ensete ventricosum]|uniref:Phytosulfokine n=1 Tax=Ensete ventricosum TaxID=4639 RepID=A0AAV8PT04_ENSVE|nr:hypothetical protein OPV22_015510 [Ensete ventricosum]